MSLFKRKKPWIDLQHEEEFVQNWSERGVETGAKLEESLVSYQDLERIHTRTKSMGLQEILAWLDKHHDEFDDTTFIVNTDDGNALDTLKGHHPRLIINKMGLTRIRHLNTFLNKANENLVDGGYLWCHSRTSSLKRQIFMRRHPGFIGKVLYAFHYLWHRVIARMKLTRWLQGPAVPVCEGGLSFHRPRCEQVHHVPPLRVRVP